MILEIVKYGHPALRQKGNPIESVTPEISKLIEDMLDTMYEARGIGLAAQQVGKAVQLTVIDVTGIEDRPSTLEQEGKELAVEDYMPLVLINPKWKAAGEPVSGLEGCLSFPEIYTKIDRAEKIDVTAMDEKGNTIEFRCGGLLARAVQHETDHLKGILFIDRMQREQKADLKPLLDALHKETKAALEKG